MKNFRILVATGLFALGFSGLAFADQGAEGIWRMENGKVTVQIAPCGPYLCGSIVALAKPLTKEGKPKVDKRNPDMALRNRPVIGLTILANMKPDGENRWRGKIYNADDGRTYSSSMKLFGDNIKVKGCVGPFCKTMLFTRTN